MKVRLHLVGVEEDWCTENISTLEGRVLGFFGGNLAAYDTPLMANLESKKPRVAETPFKRLRNRIP